MPKMALVPILYDFDTCVVNVGDLVEMNVYFGLVWNRLEGLCELR